MQAARAPVTWGRMTMAACPCPSHEFRAHTGEVRLRIRAPTEGELYTQAALALAELQGIKATADPRAAWREIEVTATDRAALLVEWLNELIYRAERDRWVPVEFAVTENSPTVFRARGRGAELAEAPSRVKAATWHNLRLEWHDGMFEAEVILDV